MVDGWLFMKKSWEEIYIYNGDILLGLARIYKSLSNLGEIRIYMNLKDYKIAKE